MCIFLECGLQQVLIKAKITSADDQVSFRWQSASAAATGLLNDAFPARDQLQFRRSVMCCDVCSCSLRKTTLHASRSLHLPQKCTEFSVTCMAAMFVLVGPSSHSTGHGAEGSCETSTPRRLRQGLSRSRNGSQFLTDNAHKQIQPYPLLEWSPAGIYCRCHAQRSASN
jgi:hypothetical protein